ncbi:MAG: hypothetical protein JJU30_07400 [Alkalimonas sp.]|nr:hypothetical protein [Alkalimonas sp.]
MDFLNRHLWLKRTVMLLVIGVALAGMFSQRHALACEAVGFYGYQQLAPNIFASPGVGNQEQVLSVIQGGKQRVESTFGPMIAAPKIVIVATKAEAARLGANSTASAHYTPLGTCIILGPNGQNVDVAAHELVHAEVGQRVGWFRHWLEIPVWFNEGVALMADHREPFLIDNIAISQEAIDAVKTLKTGRAFFAGANTHQHYVAARVAVNDLEPLQLYQQLERIRKGERFDAVFEF